MINFRKAERKQAKLRLSLCGPSGSGKTLGALLLAKGLGGKIAMIDTERGSGDLYADSKYGVEYDIVPLNAPFTPNKYIEIIKAAEQQSYDVLIIDSLTHAWTGIGGVLDLHDKATETDRSKNSWAAWRKVTPQHNELVDTILQNNMHIIVCMRTKTSWEVVEENGKKKPIKIGLAPIQKDGIEYEFTTVLDLMSDVHYFTSSKDRTEIFKDLHEKLDIKHGILLKEWLNSGKSTDDYYNELVTKINNTSNMEELKFVFDEARTSSIINDEKYKDNLIKLKDKKKTQFTQNENSTGEQQNEI